MDDLSASEIFAEGRDRTGEPYRIEHNFDSRDLKVYSGNHCVGYAYLCQRTSGVLFIADLRIKDDVPTTRSWIQSLSMKCGFQITGGSFRRRGLGTILLQAVIEQARRGDFSAVQGYLVDSDLEENPYLITWYERHGFTVTKREIPPSGEPSTEKFDIVRLVT